jgi:hypothetical protein
VTKKELIAALQASPAKDDEVAYIWCDGVRHEMELDDGTPHGGCLDLQPKDRNDEED